MLKKLFLSFILIGVFTGAHAQFGIGLTFNNDLYNRYVNPEDGLGDHRGNGSAILNLALGPKIWIGGENFSFSAETQANWSVFGLSMPDYKGLGSLSFPILGQLNFNGISGLNKEGRTGLSVGGGIQYNKTEIYSLNDDFEERGGKREYYRTYIAQVAYGFGVSGFAVKLFGRYGWNPKLDGASSLNIGIQWDFNFIKMKDISSPASEL